MRIRELPLWQTPRRPETALPKQIFRIVFDAVLRQNRPELFVKTDLSVVRLLILDVSDYGIEIRRAYAESSIPLLPRKFASLLAYPFRGIRFQQKNGFRQRKLWGQVEQEVHMVFRAANR